MLLRRIDQHLYWLLAVLGLSTVSVAYFWQGPIWVLKSLFLTCPLFLIAVLAHRFTEKVDPTTKCTSVALGLTGRHFLVATSFLLLGVSTFCLWAMNSRSLLYFCTTSALAGLIFLQVALLRSTWRTKLILPQIGLLSFSVNWGIAFKPALFFGGTDVMGHMAAAEAAKNLASGSPTSLDGSYAAAHLFHTYVAVGSTVLGVPIQYATFLMHWIAFSLVILAVFQLTHHVSEDTTAALLAALAVSVSPVFIYGAAYPVTRALALVFYSFLLVTWFSPRGGAVWPSRVLSTMYIAAIVLTHHVSVPVLFAISILVGLTSRLTSSSGMSLGPHFRDLALFGALWWSHWLFFSGDSLTQHIRDWAYAFNTATIITPDFAGSSGQGGSLVSSLLNTAYFWFLVFFTLWGVRESLHSQKVIPSAVSAVGLSALVLVFLHIPSPLSRVTSHTLWLYRLPLLTLPLVHVVLGHGASMFLRRMEKLRQLPPRFLLPVSGALVIALVTYLSLTSGSVSTDVDLYGIKRNREFFTLSEVESMRHVAVVAPPDRVILTDYYVMRNTYQISGRVPTATIMGPQLPEREDTIVILRVGQLYDGHALPFVDAASQVYWQAARQDIGHESLIDDALSRSRYYANRSTIVVSGFS